MSKIEPENKAANDMRRGSTRNVMVLVAGLFASPPVFAYIDPGTGSIILQSLLAGIAVALGIGRAYWERIKAFFSPPTARTRHTKNLKSVETKDADLDSSA